MTAYVLAGIFLALGIAQVVYALARLERPAPREKADDGNSRKMD